MTNPTLTWSPEPDRLSPKGLRYVLRSPTYPMHHFSPLCADDRLGVCGYAGPRKWEAHFFVGYDAIKADGHTAAVAMSRLEKELDKRSIGIFGADVIEFRAAR